MSIETKATNRPVTRHRALSFIGAVAIFLAILVIGRMTGFIQSFVALALAWFLAREITGIDPGSALFDSDSEIRAKLDALKKKA